MSLREQSIPGGWSDREVPIGPFRFKLLTPTNPDAVLEQIESPAASASPHFTDPYWAKLWPAAPLLAAALVRNRPQPAAAALELGCGSGLIGVTALASGYDVTFSDYVPLAVALALENAARNGLRGAKGMVLDWRARQPGEVTKFSLILAADVTYDRTNLEPLLDVVYERLSPGGEAWFGDAGRSPAPEFVERANDRGWRVTCFDEHDRSTTDFAFGQFRRIVLSK